MNRSKVKNSNQANSGNVANNMDTESDESLPSTNLDLSLLRQPIATSVIGFDEVLRAYESGTNELKKLLSKECDLIYECKVCRNIFRSLTNFISHKRVYCRSSFNASDHFHFRNNGFVVQDISTIIQAEKEINSNGIAGVLPGSDDKSKDLSGIVEQLLWKQHQSLNSNVNDFYDQIQTSKRTNAAQDDVSSSATSSLLNTKTLKLNRVNDSSIAVYQSFQTGNDNSDMKDEIDEVHKMLKKSSNTVLGPDGKVLSLFDSNDSPAALSADEDDGPTLTCLICNLQFTTQKTLKLHLEMKHLPSTYVYQCPSCTQKFTSSAAVIRHLSNDHKKSNRRIRLMRDNIIKKRVRADEVVSKAPSTSRELQKLQLSNGGTESAPNRTAAEASSEWNEHDLNINGRGVGGGDLDDSYTCPSCLKKFDRKAVYTSHVQMCSDIKDREQEKLKKRKAKTRANAAIESENSSVSEQTAAPQLQQQQQDSLNIDSGANENKRKRKRTKKVKNEPEMSTTLMPTNNLQVPKEEKEEQDDSEDVVDWNLDDEEERKKLENIKKEIIEDEYKKNQDVLPPPTASASFQLPPPPPSQTPKAEKAETIASNQDDDDDENGLVIDLKGSDEGNSFKCPTCDKMFETDEKLKYHLTYYHSRQKRFKCKMCEYQGYRKKDTLNHINFVHNAGITLEELPSHIETVSKAVDEEAVAKQNELKKNQLRIKRKMARERQRKKLADSKAGAEKSQSETRAPAKIACVKEEEEEEGVEEEDSKEQKETDGRPPAKIRRISAGEETSYLSPPQVARRPEFEAESSDYGELSPRRRELGARACKSPSRLGRKSSPNDDQSNQRPIRNRIKPVRKDFLYDLSDLLKKEADAHREQVFQSSNVTVKRELRKRAMSTHTREMPNISTFDSLSPKKSDNSFVQPLAPPTLTMEESIATPTKLKDQRNRRMSVFVSSPRQMYPSQPRSPPYKPPDAGTHKNAGSAHRMAQAACENNKASMYEPKYVWNINFEKDLKSFIPPAVPSSSVSSAAPVSSAASTSSLSAAASILQRLTGRAVEATKTKSSSAATNTNSLLKPRSTEEKPSRSTTAELCKKFELINVTNINESDFDIPNTDAAISLNNPGGNNALLSLGLDEPENDMCVLQECSDSDVDGDDDDGDDGDDSEPRLEIEGDDKRSKRGRKSTKRSTEKRRLSSNGQRRLTVMQRLQENKIRKSREQLFQRLMNQQQNDNDDDGEERASSSPEFDLFNEA